jgi:hypothetical protein
LALSEVPALAVPSDPDQKNYRSNLLILLNERFADLDLRWIWLKSCIERIYPQNIGLIGFSFGYLVVKEPVEIWILYEMNRE